MTVGVRLPPMGHCPECEGLPSVHSKWFRGSRVECGCGVRGPTVKDFRLFLLEEQEAAIVAWNTSVALPIARPPAPVGTGARVVLTQAQRNHE